MNASEALLETAAEVIPGGVNTCRRRSEPRLCFRRGAGAYLEDLDGNRFVDYHAAYGAIFLGHSHPAVTERVANAIKETVLFGVGVTEAEVALASKIVEHVPSIEQTVVCNSGSEATYHAIRLARGVTGRQQLIKFQGCYDGFHDYVLRNVLSRPDRVGRRDPHSAGMLEAAIDATLVCRYNDLDDVRQTLERHGEDVAAIIVEPVAHNSPGLLPRPGFLEGLRELCDATGALLIFDEVITGFRHHIGGYQAICGVHPDLTTLGKAIANGFPLAAIGGRREHMERLNTTADGDVHFGGTYNGNAAAVEAGLATIEQLEDGRVHEHVFALGERMRDGLTEVAARVGVPATVGGFGSLFVLCFMDGPLETYEDVLRNDDALFGRYRRELIERGVFEMPESLGRSHIGASHTAADVDRSLEAAEDALRAAVDALARL
ncbi:aspartate aminotransferase family protein [Solirubrobacter soli]|uniref:aspartate aminotransferase family protein n=1 Tax=Solirubrobacter soli TaxID=363832 RepID=UPI00042A2AD8|nr:glutamate-1-semialdehyde 2,1-aminomutase [Solirubrobacter soli]